MLIPVGEHKVVRRRGVASRQWRIHRIVRKNQIRYRCSFTPDATSVYGFVSPVELPGQHADTLPKARQGADRSSATLIFVRPSPLTVQIRPFCSRWIAASSTVIFPSPFQWQRRVY